MVCNSNENNNLIMKGCYNFFISQINEAIFLAIVLIRLLIFKIMQVLGQQNYNLPAFFNKTFQANIS